jgi:hypothetical protein
MFSLSVPISVDILGLFFFLFPQIWANMKATNADGMGAATGIGQDDEALVEHSPGGRQKGASNQQTEDAGPQTSAAHRDAKIEIVEVLPKVKQVTLY